MTFPSTGSCGEIVLRLSPVSTKMLIRTYCCQGLDYGRTLEESQVCATGAEELKVSQQELERAEMQKMKESKVSEAKYGSYHSKWSIKQQTCISVANIFKNLLKKTEQL